MEQLLFATVGGFILGCLITHIHDKGYFHEKQVKAQEQERATKMWIEYLNKIQGKEEQK